MIDYEKLEGSQAKEELCLEGVCISTLQLMQTFMEKYAMENGFKIRRNRVRRGGHLTSEIIRVEYCCHREGFKRSTKVEKVAYKKISLRCGCKAMVRFIKNKEHQFICNKHVQEHNHPFVPVEMRHLLNTCKLMSDVQNGTMRLED